MTQTKSQNNVYDLSPNTLHSEDDTESYECNQNLLDLNLQLKESHPIKHCRHCKCRLEEIQQDPAQKKRLKRKNNKQKKKDRIKEMKQKAMMILQKIMKDIYSLKITLQSVKIVVEQCLAIQRNRQVLYEKINQIIRIQVDKLIRRQIDRFLKKYQQLEQKIKNLENLQEQNDNKKMQKTIIFKIFDCIERIALGSPQIQKIINLFVSQHFDTDKFDIPIQRNLDTMTLKFLFKNDLQTSEIFASICTKVFNGEQQFKREKHLFKCMFTASNIPDADNDNYSQEQDLGYDSDDGQQWQEQSTKDSIKIDYNQIEGSGGKMRRKRERRRKMKEQFDTSFEGILKRVNDMSITQQNRAQCHVQEQWVHKMRLKRLQYLKASKNRPL